MTLDEMIALALDDSEAFADAVIEEVGDDVMEMCETITRMFDGKSPFVVMIVLQVVSAHYIVHIAPHLGKPVSELLDRLTAGTRAHAEQEMADTQADQETEA